MEITHRLQSAFIPRAVAVVGASDRSGSRGTFVWNGVMNSRLALQAYPVNPKYKYLGVTPCWSKLSELPTKIDLAVIATPSSLVKKIIEECAACEISNVLITPGDEDHTADRVWREEIVALARSKNIRLIGPDSIGIMRPEIGLNVSYWPQLPQTGHVGLLCESGSVTSTVLDYARRCAFGFSSVITSGMEADVTLAQMIDFLASDPQTEVIALHIETLRYPRPFYSALKAAMRIKPVIILKSGRGANASRVIAARTATASGDDAVFDAMLRRTGAIRCERIEEFCATIEVFSAKKLPQFGRLAVIANGLGFSALTADACDANGVRLATPSTATLEKLSKLIGTRLSLQNPLDMGADAPAERFAKALKTLLADENTDGVLVTLAPTAVTGTPKTATLLGEAAAKSHKPVIVNWVSDSLTRAIVEEFKAQHLPLLTSPDLAAKAFAHMTEYVQNRARRMTPPQEGSEAGRWNTDEARSVIDEARGQKRHQLTEAQSEKLLSAFGIRMVTSTFVSSADDAVAAAKRIGFPVALKLCADGVAHKSDLGGVILDVMTPGEVQTGFAEIQTKCRTLAPLAEFRGVFVQQMAHRVNARELSVTAETDPALGPVIRFGAGGLTGEVFRENVVGLLPLTEPLTADLIGQSRIAVALEDFRGRPAVDSAALRQVLLRVSAMISEIPAIAQVRINPLLSDEEGVVALDASVSLCSRETHPDAAYSHMLISPFPTASEVAMTSPAGLMKLRSVRSDDFLGIKRLLSRISEQSAYQRFHRKASEITDEQIIDFTQIDRDREVAILIVDDSLVGPEIHAVARFAYIPETGFAEFGLLVEDTYQAKGFGTRLMDELEKAARLRGLSLMTGYVLKGNTAMEKLLLSRGYVSSPCPQDENMLTFSLAL